MLLEYDEGQQELATLVRRKLRAAADHDGVVSSRDTHAVLEAMRIYALEAPAEADGLDLGLGDALVLCEELGRIASHDRYRANALLVDLLRDRPECGDVLRAAVGGTVVAATVDGLRTLQAQRTDRDGAMWTVSGRCAVADPVDPADLLVATMRVDGRPTLAAVPLSGAGIAVRATSRDRVTEVSLDNAPITPVAQVEAVVGATGSPVPGLVRGQVRQAGYLLGLAAGAHQLAVRRAGERRQFGRPVGEYQAIAFPLAAQLAEVEATRLLIHRAGWLAEREPAGRATAVAALQALASAAELAFAATRHAMHVHGAFGMTTEAPIHRYYLAVAVEGIRWGAPEWLWTAAGRLDRTAG